MAGEHGVLQAYPGIENGSLYRARHAREGDLWRVEVERTAGKAGQAVWIRIIEQFIRWLGVRIRAEDVFVMRGVG